MKHYVPLLRDPADRLDRLDPPDLIVGMHDRDQDRVRSNCGRNRLWVYQTGGVHRQIGHLIALTLQRLDRVDHGMMLDPGYDEMPAALGQGLHNTLDCKVVRFT